MYSCIQNELHAVACFYLNQFFFLSSLKYFHFSAFDVCSSCCIFTLRQTRVPRPSRLTRRLWRPSAPSARRTVKFFEWLTQHNHPSFLHYQPLNLTPCHFSILLHTNTHILLYLSVQPIKFLLTLFFFPLSLPTLTDGRPGDDIISPTGILHIHFTYSHSVF